VVQAGEPALEAIVKRWGAGVLRPDGSLDRPALRAIIFADAAERVALNAIVHPYVRKRRDELVSQARARGDAVVVAVIPLLFETGLEREFDRVVLVDAPEDVREARLLKRSAIAATEARRMMDAQMPVQTKRTRSDHVIENDADLAALRRSVERVWTDLTRGAQR
jgi:dephospho-CoA kinase